MCKRNLSPILKIWLWRLKWNCLVMPGWKKTSIWDSLSCTSSSSLYHHHWQNHVTKPDPPPTSAKKQFPDLPVTSLSQIPKEVLLTCINYNNESSLGYFGSSKKQMLKKELNVQEFYCGETPMIEMKEGTGKVGSVGRRWCKSYASRRRGWKHPKMQCGPWKFMQDLWGIPESTVVGRGALHLPGAGWS